MRAPVRVCLILLLVAAAALLLFALLKESDRRNIQSFLSPLPNRSWNLPRFTWQPPRTLLRPQESKSGLSTPVPVGRYRKELGYASAGWRK
ncbi:MAG: hypothetical protein ACUVTA_07095 [Thermodesulfitimonas sp.]